jgi:hypothetical protein
MPAIFRDAEEPPVTETIDPQAMLSRNPSILFNDFDDGIMMMNIDSGHYFDVEPIGARIWSLLEQPTSLASICDILADEYEVDGATCLAQTGEFLSDLVAKGLIQAA